MKEGVAVSPNYDFADIGGLTPTVLPKPDGRSEPLARRLGEGSVYPLAMLSCLHRSRPTQLIGFSGIFGGKNLDFFCKNSGGERLK